MAENTPAPAPPHEWVKNDPRWPSIRDIEFCAICGLGRRADGLDKPCRGSAPSVGLREKPAPVEPVAPVLDAAALKANWQQPNDAQLALLRQLDARSQPSPEPAPASPEEPLTEQQEIDGLFKHYRALLDRHGWRETIYAPKDRPIQAITIGSAGIFTAHWLTCAWFVEEAHDLWPARLIAWRELPKREASK